MRNDTILFQHIMTNSDYIEAAELTTPRTLAYCKKFKYDYRLFVGPVTKYYNMPGHWAVPALILEYLKEGYENVIYIDSDCIIVDMESDMRQVCIPNKIGAVWHDLTPWPDENGRNLSCYNVGVLYARNTPKVIEFTEVWLHDAPGSSAWPWWENGSFNIIGKRMETIQHLDNRWNAGHVSPSDNIAVWGFHGLPDRINTMRLAITVMDKQPIKLWVPPFV